MSEKVHASIPAGILIEGGRDLCLASTIDEFNRLFQRLNLQDLTQVSPSAQRADGCIAARRQQQSFDRWCPDFDTLQVRTFAHDRGYLLAPGALFHARRELSTLMRINFATTQEAQFWEDFRAARGTA
jgi:hypothetical protein